jgi:hypothetical protein
MSARGLVVEARLIAPSITVATTIQLPILRVRVRMTRVKVSGGLHPDIDPPKKKFTPHWYDRQFAAREDLASVS